MVNKTRKKRVRLLEPCQIGAGRAPRPSGPGGFLNLFWPWNPFLLLLFSKGILLGTQYVGQIKMETSPIDVSRQARARSPTRSMLHFFVEATGSLEPGLRTTDLFLCLHHTEDERRQGPSVGEGERTQAHTGSGGRSRLEAELGPGPSAVPQTGAGFPDVRWHGPHSSPTKYHSCLLSGAREIARNRRGGCLISLLHNRKRSADHQRGIPRAARAASRGRDRNPNPSFRIPLMPRRGVALPLVSALTPRSLHLGGVPGPCLCRPGAWSGQKPVSSFTAEEQSFRNRFRRRTADPEPRAPSPHLPPGTILGDLQCALRGPPCLLSTSYVSGIF